MSNIAHTSEFQMAYLNVVRDAFRRHSSDEADLKAISFLFGVIAHNEADNPFHFGDGSATPAFLTAALGADPDNNETSVELAGDLFCVYEYGEMNSPDVWSFPVDTVRAAYAALGHDVPALGLQQGLEMVAAVHFGLKPWTLANFSLYQFYANVDLIWAHNNLATYPVGGMQDAANHSAVAWQSAWDELSTYRLFLPGMLRSSVTYSGSGLQDGAHPTASAGLPTSDELSRASYSDLYTTRMLLLARKRIEAGVVKVHAHTEDGIYTIERVEVLDYQRLDQLTRQMLGVPASRGAR